MTALFASEILESSQSGGCLELVLSSDCPFPSLLHSVHSCQGLHRIETSKFSAAHISPLYWGPLSQLRPPSVCQDLPKPQVHKRSQHHGNEQQPGGGPQLLLSDQLRLRVGWRVQSSGMALP